MGLFYSKNGAYLRLQKAIYKSVWAITKHGFIETNKAIFFLDQKGCIELFLFILTYVLKSTPEFSISGEISWYRKRYIKTCRKFLTRKLDIKRYEYQYDTFITKKIELYEEVIRENFSVDTVSLYYYLFKNPFSWDRSAEIYKNYSTLVSENYIEYELFENAFKELQTFLNHELDTLTIKILDYPGLSSLIQANIDSREGFYPR